MEIVVLLIVALLVFGPKRLPEMGRSVGNGLREFKGSLTGESREEEPQLSQSSLQGTSGSFPLDGEVEDEREPAKRPA